MAIQRSIKQLLKTMNSSRISAALAAAATHLFVTASVALLAAALVFGLWFPGVYRLMAGGTELFLLIVVVDIVCGPLLTCVLFDPLKSKRDLFLDIGLIALVQLIALMYGLWTLWEVRPLYLAHEHDRFKVVSHSDLRGGDTTVLPIALRPAFFKGPQVVGLRDAKDNDERNKVLLDALSGGADYGERPDFFVLFDKQAAAKTIARSKAVKDFLLRYPSQKVSIDKISVALNQPIEQMRYLPIRSRNDWIAVLTPAGQIAEFIPGDGF